MSRDVPASEATLDKHRYAAALAANQLTSNNRASFDVSLNEIFMSATPLLQLRHVGRVLAGRPIVTDISLNLDRGSVLGLLGVNGAGKSTTLRMIAGVLAPSTGQVLIAGEDLCEHPQSAHRRLGYLPEQVPLYAELRVAEYLDFCARLHGLRSTAVQRAVASVIERCALGDVRRRLLGNLSKGFQQRVGIAQAIVHDPALIVLDEPASGLDPVQAANIRTLVRELGREHAVKTMNQADRRPSQVIRSIRLQGMHAILGPTFGLTFNAIEQSLEPGLPIRHILGKQPSRRDSDDEFPSLDLDNDVGTEGLGEQSLRDRPAKTRQRQLERDLRSIDREVAQPGQSDDQLGNVDLLTIIQWDTDNHRRGIVGGSKPIEAKEPSNDQAQRYVIRHRRGFPGVRGSIGPSPHHNLHPPNHVALSSDKGDEDVDEGGGAGR